MSHEQAIKTTASIFVDTIQHMADQSGLSFEEVLKKVVAGEPAKERLNQYLEVAEKFVASI